ncbi:hypothetical protein [Neobacillus mesonae]|uniref:Uncharacterized protein n=1 Tax=Neobacillus mesonae TaxID=1193713 RepID=A0A3Q9QT73_9BACI|nr:hypothetical protein [Neobacillus mesonae]AZU61015.1 hypothetical protein CHR53_06985 [Neobacillus mesonae]
MAKPNAKDWRNRDITDWVVATFQQYLKDAHEERYGIAYTARNYGLEGRWLKSMISEHGSEAVKAFIDACFADYRPTAQYPGLNFSFMFSYQRSRILPRVLADSKRRQFVKQAVEETEDLSDWL